MIQMEIDPRQLNFLIKLSKIPRNINEYKDRYNVIEFILHELCHEECLNLKKAAYFIDNHDFDCLHGVVGIDTNEKFSHEDIWQVPDQFSNYMKQLSFNNKVKELRTVSSKSFVQDELRYVKQLAQDLGMQDVSCSVIPLRHDNKGVFVYEPQAQGCLEEHDILNGLNFLGLCPLLF
ncbi:hypothetical protein IPH25_04725 [bacterium]|nr:MAG: hypothetical protein IPG37_01720 [bacterium]QQR61744.1 MAG: hypothetical protein IPH25_04725 [bacterium]QQR62685.1 MAG: hypothetical protein IPH67_04695 [bacterium]